MVTYSSRCSSRKGEERDSLHFGYCCFKSDMVPESECGKLMVEGNNAKYCTLYTQVRVNSK